MVTLSEKAKGKQRAVEPQDGEEGTEANQRMVTVRFTDGLPDLIVALSPKDNIRALKQQIRAARPQLAKNRLRLIYSGRILSDDVFLSDWLYSLEKRQQLSSEVQNSKGKFKDDDNASIGANSPTWIHCSIGAEMSEEEENEVTNQESQIKPLRGFDRLATVGFTEEDIASFRRQFHNQTSGDYLDTDPLGEDEDYEEHARNLEEQWIDSLDDGRTSAIEPSVSTTLLQGLIVGFFFPLIPFFFLREARPAVFWANGSAQERNSTVVFSKRMQMALVLGFIINLTFGMWRYLLGS